MAFAVAWRILTYQKGRTALAIGGIFVAILLIFVELGFFTAVPRGGLLIYDNMRFDLLVTSNRYAYQTESGTFARAFVYAQARALLVSHWAVDSNATVQLITTAMREIARDKAVGRSEALRRAMLALIDSGEPQAAHPSYWAPFIVVGEGRR